MDGLPSPLSRDSIVRAVGLGSPTLNIRRPGPLDARSIHRLQGELKSPHYPELRLNVKPTTRVAETPTRR